MYRAVRHRVARFLIFIWRLSIFFHTLSAQLCISLVACRKQLLTRTVDGRGCGRERDVTQLRLRGATARKRKTYKLHSNRFASLLRLARPGLSCRTRLRLQRFEAS